MNDRPDPVPSPPPAEADWERQLLKRFAYDVLREQRSARRWSIFFKLAVLLYVLGLFIVSWRSSTPGAFVGARAITAVVDLQGIIASDTQASADTIVTGLRNAFEDKRTRGVILRINSPGGSPVQSGYINDEIYRLKKEHPKVPIYAVLQDICASGGYYVAVAADEIYADKATIVGSIGVRMDGFGFVDAMEKLGVERRLLTSGEHKAFLDPFSPLKQEEVAHVSGLLQEIHQQFINTVKRGRGKRLKEGVDYFNGYVWSGERGLELGLVDGLGSASYVAREIIGAEDLVDFTPHENVLQQVSRRFGAELAALLREKLSLSW
ncbi:MAG TPA: S49 family peptidase [Gammaproteobacteria bacterium]|nr:S49 family peptidase [Gammaproteobacteria bacterium]